MMYSGETQRMSLSCPTCCNDDEASLDWRWVDETTVWLFCHECGKENVTQHSNHGWDGKNDWSEPVAGQAKHGWDGRNDWSEPAAGQAKLGGDGWTDWSEPAAGQAKLGGDGWTDWSEPVAGQAKFGGDGWTDWSEPAAGQAKLGGDGWTDWSEPVAGQAKHGGDGWTDWSEPVAGQANFGWDGWTEWLGPVAESTMTPPGSTTKRTGTGTGDGNCTALPEDHGRERRNDDHNHDNGHAGGAYLSDFRTDVPLENAQSAFWDATLSSGCPCGNRQNFELVTNNEDGSLLLRKCLECRNVVGMDDSHSLEDMLAILQRNGALKTDPCAKCRYDNIDNFLVEAGINGGTVLRCENCGETHEVTSPEAESIPDSPRARKPPGSSDSATLLRPPSARPSAPPLARPSAAPSACGRASGAPTSGTNLAPVAACTGSTRGTRVGYRLVKHSSELSAADHISWLRSLSYIHHAIVTDVSRLDPDQVKVIHYDGPVSDVGGKGVIRENWESLSGDEVRVEIYDGCSPPDVVLQRARTRLGEAEYSLAFNNCEHFATFAKTGHGQSDQVDSVVETATRFGKLLVQDPWEVATKDSCKLLGKDAAAKAIVPAIRLVDHKLLRTSQPKTALPKTTRGGDRGGSQPIDWRNVAGMAAVEGVHALADIKHIHQQMVDGHIGGKEFKKEAVHRGVRSGISIMGSLAGTAIAAVLNVPPGLGQQIGGSLGGLVGQALGNVVGVQARKLVK